MTTTGIVIAVFVVIAQIVGAILKQRAERAEAERRRQAQRGEASGGPAPAPIGPGGMADDGTGTGRPPARREMPRPSMHRPLGDPATVPPMGREGMGGGGRDSGVLDRGVARGTRQTEERSVPGRRDQSPSSSVRPPPPPPRPRPVVGSTGSSGPLEAQRANLERPAQRGREVRAAGTQSQGGARPGASQGVSPGGGKASGSGSGSGSGVRSGVGSGVGSGRPAAPSSAPGSAFGGTHYDLEHSPILVPVASIESSAAAAMARPTGRSGVSLGKSGEALTISIGGMALGATLRSPQALRAAFLLTEVLGRPAADRFGAGGVSRSDG